LRSVYFPGQGVLLPARVNTARAARPSGRAVNAGGWRDAGLVAFTAPDAEHAGPWMRGSRTLALFRRIAPPRGRPPAHRCGGPRRDLAEAERLYLNDLMVTHDANEGVRAFLDKRPPRWKDE
jgi:enoyl-CoA hydratase/carnithine racemase